MRKIIFWVFASIAIGTLLNLFSKSESQKQILSIPSGVDTKCHLDSFVKLETPNFYAIDPSLSCKNFNKVTDQLEAGCTYEVEFIPCSDFTTEECIVKLKNKKALLVGAQGLALLLQYGKEIIPKGKWLASFDEIGNLLKDSQGSPQVPLAHLSQKGAWQFVTGYADDVWGTDNEMVCITKK